MNIGKFEYSHLWMFATWNLIGSFSVFTLIIWPMEKVFAGTFCVTSVERSCTDKKGSLSKHLFEWHVSTRSELKPFPFQYDMMLPNMYSTTTTTNFIFTWKAINYKYRLPANIPKCLFLIEMIWPETLLKIMPQDCKKSTSSWWASLKNVVAQTLWYHSCCGGGVRCYWQRWKLWSENIVWSNLQEFQL